MAGFTGLWQLGGAGLGREGKTCVLSWLCKVWGWKHHKEGNLTRQYKQAVFFFFWPVHDTAPLSVLSKQLRREQKAPKHSSHAATWTKARRTHLIRITLRRNWGKAKIKTVKPEETSFLPQQGWSSAASPDPRAK